jgi:hypothetical protein
MHRCIAYKFYHLVFFTRWTVRGKTPAALDGNCHTEQLFDQLQGEKR